MAFTLIELMAVLVVIAMLVGLTIQIAGFARKRAGTVAAKATLVAIQSALDAYYTDFGYYPVSFPTNVSANGFAEAENNYFLYRALTGQGKKYFTLTSMVAPNPGPNNLYSSYYSYVITNIFDPFGKPFNYYNSPSTVFNCPNCNPNPATGANTGYLLGGQVNKTSYDLYSYGPDGVTFPTWIAVQNSGGGAWLKNWQNTGGSLDDIWSEGNRVLINR